MDNWRTGQSELGLRTGEKVREEFREVGMVVEECERQESLKHASCSQRQTHSEQHEERYRAQTICAWTCSIELLERWRQGGKEGRVQWIFGE